MTEIAEKAKTHPHRKDYTDQEIEIGLTALALCSGRRNKAAELVKTQGLTIPAETLRHWAERNRVEEYARVRAIVAPQLREQLADVHQSLVASAAELEAKTITRLDERLSTGDVEDKDLANILKNAAIATGIHTEKAQLLNDQPTERRAIDLPGTLAELKSLGVEPKHVLNLDVVSEEAVETEPAGLDGSTSESQAQGSGGLADHPESPS